MSKDKIKSESKSSQLDGKTSSSKSENTRRTLLRNTLIGSGAVLSTSVMPDKWKKPLLEAVVLPSHAQMSVNSVVMGGGSGIQLAKQDDGFNAEDIFGVFISEANAGEIISEDLLGGCLVMTIENSVATVELILNTNATDTKQGTVTGTSVIVTGLHTGYTVTGTLDSATAPTACIGMVNGFGESGNFQVSSADPVCAAVGPTTTPGPTSTPPPTTGPPPPPPPPPPPTTGPPPPPTTGPPPPPTTGPPPPPPPPPPSES